MIVMQIVLAFVWMCLLPFLTGCIFTKLFCKKNMWNVFLLTAVGIMIHYAVYEVLALIFIKLDLSFRLLTKLYAFFGVAAGATGLFALFTNRKELTAYMASKYKRTESTEGNTEENAKTGVQKKKSKLSLYLLGAFLIIFIQIAAILLWATPDKDDAFYSGLSSMSIAGDYVLKYDAYQGKMNALISNRYAISALPVYQASLSLLSGDLHHLFITHNLFPLFYIPLAYGLLYCVGRVLLGENKEKLHPFLFFLTLLHLFGNYFVFSPQNFLVTRIWQGKALFICLAIPFLYLMVRETYNAKTKSELFIFWMIIAMGMFGITFMGETGLYLGPLMMVALTLANAIEKKRYWNFLWGFLTMIPQGIIVLMFLL